VLFSSNTLLLEFYGIILISTAGPKTALSGEFPYWDAVKIFPAYGFLQTKTSFINFAVARSRRVLREVCARLAVQSAATLPAVFTCALEFFALFFLPDFVLYSIHFYINRFNAYTP